MKRIDLTSQQLIALNACMLHGGFADPCLAELPGFTCPVNNRLLLTPVARDHWRRITADDHLITLDGRVVIFQRCVDETYYRAWRPMPIDMFDIE